MNKYLKMLMLSGGLVGAIAPTAIDFEQKDTNTDLGYIYTQVERMQDALPRLSRIDYKLNIDLDDPVDNATNQETINPINEDTSVDDNFETSTSNKFIDTEAINNENIDNTDNNNKNINTNNPINNTADNSSANVTFSTTDENGNVSDLTNSETLNYLNQTLNQTNIEYENLKTNLTNAIKETMDYLEAYKNGEQTLTNEQKIYIKEHSYSIKFLAETLEDLSEEVICAIDCKDCEECDEDFDITAGKYLTTINELETRIQTLQNAISSLQFINNISNPFFNRGYHIMYDFNHNNEYTDTEDGSIEVEENSTNESMADLETDNENNNTNNEDISTDTNNVTENTNQANIGDSTETDEKPTTFGLQSNIDTYAPTKRNIDTFFNTARLNDDYMYGGGYGYGMPYGFGGNYGGYGNPYSSGFGNPYARNGFNSNMVNRATLENSQNNLTDSSNNFANIENNTDNNNSSIEKPKRFRAKRAKNVDTYSGVTIKSNINTMGESKISKFFKEKFNNLRNKVKNQKEELQNNNQFENNNEVVNQDNSNNNQNEENIASALQQEINNQINQTNNIENKKGPQDNGTANTSSDNNLNILNNTPNNIDNMSNIDSPIPIYEEQPLTR